MSSVLQDQVRVGRLKPELRNGLFFLLCHRGSGCFSEWAYIFQARLWLYWDGLFWERVFSALICLTPPRCPGRERVGIWSCRVMREQSRALPGPAGRKVPVLLQLGRARGRPLDEGCTRPGGFWGTCSNFLHKPVFCFSRGKSSGCLGGRF